MSILTHAFPDLGGNPWDYQGAVIDGIERRWATADAAGRAEIETRLRDILDLPAAPPLVTSGDLFAQTRQIRASAALVVNGRLRLGRWFHRWRDLSVAFGCGSHLWDPDRQRLRSDGPPAPVAPKRDDAPLSPIGQAFRDAALGIAPLETA